MEKCKKPVDEKLRKEFAESVQRYPWMLVCSIVHLPESFVESFRKTVSDIGCTSLFIAGRVIKHSLRLLSEFFGSLTAKAFVKGLLKNKGQVLYIFGSDFAHLDAIISFTQLHNLHRNKPCTSESPHDVVIRPHSTNLEPRHTPLFTQLNIVTKIVRARIEIIRESILLRKGQKISPEHKQLIDKMDLKPFKYGINVERAYFKGNKISFDEMQEAKSAVLNGLRLMQGLSIGTGVDTSLAGAFHIAKVMRNAVHAFNEGGQDIQFYWVYFTPCM
eukprot:TRINITY_DN122649_c0_g1_i1.p1 TRINITY_DN122649_c0_g1~~TRINITY_DN122649_c0_g1_i1.p1  ORF type:complete len:301 (-),score=10.25 TRINITY_DN122649_c0_g1_i1:27-848(-)